MMTEQTFDGDHGLILPSGRTVMGSLQDFPMRLADAVRTSTADSDRVLLLGEIMRFSYEMVPDRLSIPVMLPLIEAVEAVETQARMWLLLGQYFERLESFRSAADAYGRGVHLDPADCEVRYFLHNNLGYSLNEFGEHETAEDYCRQAIDIDPQRHNAHKNLGLALQGQGRFVEAARALLSSVAAAPSNPRALRHLRSLLSEKPEIRGSMPDIEHQLAKCAAMTRDAQDGPQKV